MNTPRSDGLPAYAPQLAAYHRAFAPELRALVAGLPLRPGDRVLDLACGDGTYAAWLADRVGPSGSVTAVDASHAFLDLARAHADGRRVGLVAADVAALPFADDTFDLVWCAQSLCSLPGPVASVRRLARVVRPGGTVAVLENDSLHHVLLPWPVDVELAARAAELAAFAAESGEPRKFYVGRDLRAVCRRAGLTAPVVTTRATNRHAPLDADARAFLDSYLSDLRARALPRLAPATAARFAPLVDPHSNAYILDDPDLTVTCLDHVVCATRPAG